jgi:hypothetical protein
MIQPRTVLKGASGVSLLFAVLGALAAAKYLSIEVPETEKVSGIVLTSDLKARNWHRQWIEFTLQGSGTEFVYDHPFSDVKRMASELLPGTQVSMEIARRSTIEVWSLSLNGRKHVAPEDVLELHRQKGWAAVAIATIALLVCFALVAKNARTSRRGE